MDEQNLSDLLAVLSEPTRRKALALLSDGRELCVCELMAALDASQSRMSRHMAALKAAGLVTDRRDAQWVRYRRVQLRSKSVQRIVEAVLAPTTTTALAKPARSGRVRDKELTP